MGRVASSVDNTMMESFWSTMQRELLDRHRWTGRDQLASAIFKWIEGFYNHTRRHSGIGNLSQAQAATATRAAAPGEYQLIQEPEDGYQPIYQLIMSATSSIDVTMYELADRPPRPT